MAVAQLVAVGGLALAVVGGATATDAVSLRELAHAVNVPVLSGAVLMAREAMPNSVAHMLEPLAALSGSLILAVPALRRLLTFVSSARLVPSSA